jgi:D-glycero-beta-D-manno-heptose 1-phosphate adenylyltransferase
MGQYFSETTALIEKLDSVRKNNKRIVFTNGCFDLLHIGHVKYLKEAKSKGDFLVVGINSDASVKRLKGPTRPIQTETDRSEILAALEAVDATVIFTEDTPEMLIKMLRPDVLVKGGDWKIHQIVGGDFVQSNGGQVLSLMFIDGKSTTNIVSKIEQK